ncbi:MAG: glucosamine-6-phosphate deaminase [Prosthecobacter sp.]
MTPYTSSTGNEPDPLTAAYEKVPTHLFIDSLSAARALAAEVRELITSRAKEGRNAVLGLATGSTPLPFYRELIRLHREEGLSFANVVSFNLDEYCGLAVDHPESYARFMSDQLFDHIDLPKQNIHIPSGAVPGDLIFAHCRNYEEMIQAAGGIDIQILGIGRTGHIGFNEPGSSRDCRTRRITLDRVTRQDAAADFRGEENVPRFAITMGVGTILNARKIVLMAWGDNKAEIVQKAVEGQVTDAISASFLQEHQDARFFIDASASCELTRIKLPWLVGPVDWTPNEVRRAVCWLSSSLNCPVLMLTDEHYNEHGLSDLLSDKGPAYQLNIRIFNEMQHTITGWPGGKPNVDDTDRPERAKPYPKQVLVFSPEPQDAIVAMGATIERLIEHGHDVTIVTMTSGNLRVADNEVNKFCDILLGLAGSAEPSANWEMQGEYANDILKALEAKGPFGEDTSALRHLKSLVLRSELVDALGACKVAHERVKILCLPFYERGRYRRFDPTDEDVSVVANLLREHNPHQIFFTGKGADLGSVAGICSSILKCALKSLSEKERLNPCSYWFYTNKGNRIALHDIDMAVPLSPAQLERKLLALSHFSKLSSLEIGGLEENRQSARNYDQLGLAEYAALEPFQRWQGNHTA